MKSTNPYTGKLIAEYNEMNPSEVESIINSVNLQFEKWRYLPVDERGRLMVRLAKLLKEKKKELARLITLEMGKLTGEAQAEIEKCAWLCEHYAGHAPDMINTETMASDGSKSYVRFDPTGVILAIMPWNFPFWQALRFAIPTLMAGNTVVLKHASNVTGCALAIEKLFNEAGFPDNVFRTLILPSKRTEEVIGHHLVQGVTITGSMKAGKSVAALAGKYLKKSVLELGGSDPFIVLADADFNEACQTGTKSRMMNSGQVCISAKRFIVEESIFDRFVEEQTALLETLTAGDPMLDETTLAPLARPDLVDEIHKQVTDSTLKGARLVTGGKKINENFYAPTLLTNVSKGMPVYDEETFGPVSVVLPAKNAEDAVRIANDTVFGLGTSIWTKNLKRAEEMAAHIDAGAIFINGLTKSDPRLPFGGTKRSGYGRELSHFGIREFMNIKTVWVK